MNFSVRESNNDGFEVVSCGRLGGSTIHAGDELCFHLHSFRRVRDDVNPESATGFGSLRSRPIEERFTSWQEMKDVFRGAEGGAFNVFEARFLA